MASGLVPNTDKTVNIADLSHFSRILPFYM
jgi:hypothetical protein